jgi:uncharacterized protein YrzB (UPF0473 family)
MKDNSLIITTEDGKQINCKILFTHHSDEFNKDYVVFVDENNVASAAIYNDSDDGKGELIEIKTDAEWNMLEKLLNEYNEDDEKACDNSCEGCDGNCSCANNEE